MGDRRSSQVGECGCCDTLDTTGTCAYIGGMTSMTLAFNLATGVAFLVTGGIAICKRSDVGAYAALAFCTAYLGSWALLLTQVR